MGIWEKNKNGLVFNLQSAGIAVGFVACVWIAYFCRSTSQHLKILKLPEVTLQIKHISYSSFIIANGRILFGCSHPPAAQPRVCPCACAVSETQRVVV